MKTPIGNTYWAVPEGFLPSRSNGPAPEMVSHEALCVLNVGDQTAHLLVTIFFEDREPAGPYRLEVSSRRTRHFRLNELREPEPIPFDTPFASTVESDVPVVVQHTRLDSRQAENALMTTMAYPAT